MKKLLFSLAALFLLFSCSKDDYPDLNFKEEMREFVIGISDYARLSSPGFIIVPQNGIELVTRNGGENDSLHASYLSAIDGNGQEDLFYVYDKDDKATSEKESVYLQTFLDKSKNAGKVILVTDYCSTHSNMDNSYAQNSTAGYISFAASERELNNIPAYPNQIVGENSNTVTRLSEIRNFLYLINNENYSSKTDLINAVTATNYDLLGYLGGFRNTLFHHIGFYRVNCHKVEGSFGNKTGCYVWFIFDVSFIYACYILPGNSLNVCNVLFNERG